MGLEGQAIDETKWVNLRAGVCVAWGLDLGHFDRRPGRTARQSNMVASVVFEFVARPDLVEIDAQLLG